MANPGMANKADDEFTPDEARVRFEATLKGALKTPPIPATSKRRSEMDGASASSSSAGTDRH
jgi:hypothetical protein